MLIKKLRLAVGTVLVLAALGAVGLGYQAGADSGAAQAAPPDRAQNELEALRQDNELLKLNLRVVLEKVRAQEAELKALRKPARDGDVVADAPMLKRYPVSSGTAEAVAKMLQRVYRGSLAVRISAAGPKEVMVWAAPGDHADIAVLIKAHDSATPPKP